MTEGRGWTAIEWIRDTEGFIPAPGQGCLILSNRKLTTCQWHLAQRNKE